MNLQLGGRLLFIAVIAASTACTKSKPVSDQPADHQDIFSNRPIHAVPDVFVVTLNAPALLTVAKKTSNGWEIPASAKADVLNEQAQFEQKIKNISAQAQIIYRYRMTLNALAIYAPADALPQIAAIAGVRGVAPARELGRPLATDISAADPVQKVNSATFIGANEAYAQGFTGRGMRIGVLDTGIDFTHKMLGGSGNPSDFSAVNPAQASPFFPNNKVIGGLDLVGTEFNAASTLPAERLPHPDSNPIDEAGHGSHVAGTIAGIGDGVDSFDGVAKDAQLYAIKVFGKNGSTMDAVVIAGFEYAADPNGDLDPSDQLDVINLSLGGGFGQPQILYTEAVRNLSRAGTVVVCSAGNSGAVDYIVGAPGTSDEAISVAASIDGSPHNWQFSSVRFITAANPDMLVKAVEGGTTKPIAELMTPVEGELVDIGLADTELTPEVKAKLQGNIAFISRGKIPFAQKLALAVANGAAGVVVYNNDPGKPIVMGGDVNLAIPGIMITQALGMNFLAEMKTGAAVRIQFVTGKKIEEPDLIDSITEFSSKGPRSEDNLLKPEIAAPGSRVISAAMGQGTKTVQMDGTSMAAPHMSGAMALIKQARPGLTSEELKSLAMSSSKILNNKQGLVATTLQGAGRVQIDQALKSPIVITPASLSLGGIALQDTRSEVRKLTLHNLTAQEITLDLSSEASSGLALNLSSAQVTLPANGSVDVNVNAVITMTSPQTAVQELDGRVKIQQNGALVAQVPALAIRTKASMIRTPQTSVSGPIALTNSSPVMGMALAFNLLGEDTRKETPSPSQSWKSRSCDLQSVGYRTIKKQTNSGPVDVIQFGFKLFTPMTTWQTCELSVLIDADGDGVPDQELAGVLGANIEGLGQVPFASILLDAAKARSIRLTYEMALSAGTKTELDYKGAVLGGSGMAPFEHSTLAVVEAPVQLLAKSKDGKLNVKVAALLQGGDAVEADDYLGASSGSYMKIDAEASAQPFFGMSEFSIVPATGGSSTVTRGSTFGKLILYYPMNPINGTTDTQFQILD